MYLPDLSLFPAADGMGCENIYAVGWITPKSYSGSTGNFKYCMFQDIPDKNVIFRIRGSYPCRFFCDKTAFGFGEIWIKDRLQGSVFAMPSLIRHYIKFHGYSVPLMLNDVIKNNSYDIISEEEAEINLQNARKVASYPVNNISIMWNPGRFTSFSEFELSVKGLPISEWSTKVDGYYAKINHFDSELFDIWCKNNPDLATDGVNYIRKAT